MAEITGLDGLPISSGKTITVTLQYETASGKLAIDGDLWNLEMVLNVLGQASRWLQCRYEAQQHMILSDEMQRDQELMRMTRQ